MGPVRFTLSKRGLGTSIGAGGVRVGRSPTGRRWLSISLLGTGLGFIRYFSKKR